MKTISYLPSQDEIRLIVCPVKGKPTKELEKFKIWWDEEGNICALSIKEFTQQLREFQKTLHTVQLGGIWKGTRITDKDIKLGRRALLKKLEDKF